MSEIIELFCSLSLAKRNYKSSFSKDLSRGSLWERESHSNFGWSLCSNLVGETSPPNLFRLTSSTLRWICSEMSSWTLSQYRQLVSKLVSLWASISVFCMLFKWLSFAFGTVNHWLILWPSKWILRLWLCHIFFRNFLFIDLPIFFLANILATSLSLFLISWVTLTWEAVRTSVRKA